MNPRRDPHVLAHADRHDSHDMLKDPLIFEFANSSRLGRCGRRI